MYIPKIYRNADFSKLDQELQDDFKNQLGKSKGVCLLGDSGVGKSYAMYAFARRLEVTMGQDKEIAPCEEYPKGHFKRGTDIMFYDVDILIHKFRDFSDENETLNYLTGQSGRTGENHNVLFLDDLGVQKNSDFAIEKLTMILNYRTGEELPTFISTNYSPEELAEQLGKRIYSRVQSLCKMIPMVGEDRRKGEIK